MRSLAKRLLNLPHADWNDWEIDFLEHMGRHKGPDPITTRQGEKLLELRDDAEYYSAVRGFGVQSLIENCWLARDDLDSEDDRRFIEQLKETDVRASSAATCASYSHVRVNSARSSSRLNRQLTCSLARAGPCGFLRRPMRAFLAPTANALCVHASAQSIHETDDFRWLALSRRLDLLAGLLLLQQLLQRVFVVVLKFFGLEVAGLGFDDV